MKKLINACLLIFISQLAFGQNNDFGTGLLFDKTSYEQLPSVVYDYGNGSKSGGLPVEVSLKKWTPKIQNQKAAASCVGWAMGYGCLSIMNAKLNNWTNPQKITDEAFSSLFIYNQINTSSNCSKGIFMKDAAKFILKNGICKSIDFDYPIEDCQRQPSLELIKAAQKVNIKSYLKIFEIDDAPEKKIEKIKINLSEGFPVVIGLNIQPNFKELKDEYWTPDPDYTNKEDNGHAVVIIGYDEYKGAFEIMNSWGKDWANEGFCWIRYDDIGKYTCSGYRFIIDKADLKDRIRPTDTKKIASYKGHFQFKKLNRTDYPKPGFYSYPVQKISDYTYTSKENKWKINDTYRLCIEEAQVNRFVYVFSIDAKGSNIHWPKMEKSTEGTERLASSMIAFDNVKITIPSSKGMLYKQVKGDDNIIILYAYNKIEDFEARVNKVKNAKGTIESRFQIGFSDIIIANQTIDYAPNEMKFETQIALSKKNVIPMILKLTDATD
ncbi:MAG: C1 family peptidase [Saprospiraceae bacterium]